MEKYTNNYDNKDVFDKAKEMARKDARPLYPKICPITGRPFFMELEREGEVVPTYGGPFDSYTVPEKDDDGNYYVHRYDHDDGCWVEDESLDERLVIEHISVLVKDTIKAWESLEGDKHYSPREVETWLLLKMKPAIDQLRRWDKVNSEQNPERSVATGDHSSNGDDKQKADVNNS